MIEKPSATNDNRLGGTGRAIGWILALVAIMIGLFHSSIAFSPGTSVWVFDVKINGLLVIGFLIAGALKKLEKQEGAKTDG